MDFFSNCYVVISALSGGQQLEQRIPQEQIFPLHEWQTLSREELDEKYSQYFIKADSLNNHFEYTQYSLTLDLLNPDEYILHISEQADNSTFAHDFCTQKIFITGGSEIPPYGNELQEIMESFERIFVDNPDAQIEIVDNELYSNIFWYGLYGLFQQPFIKRVKLIYDQFKLSNCGTLLHDLSMARPRNDFEADKAYDIIKELISNGINIDCYNKRGSTPLMLACSQGNYKIVSLLLNNGADANARDNNGRTPLMRIAAMQSDIYNIVPYELIPKVIKAKK